MVSHEQRTLISMFFTTGVTIHRVKIVTKVIIALFADHASPSPAVVLPGAGVPGVVVLAFCSEPEFNVFSE